MMEGLDFAREIGLPLNTHLIIHWGGTLVGDDPDGNLFAKFRYLLDKRFRRKFGIELTGIWVRERHRNKHTRQPSEVTHSHLLLHLPSQHRKAARQDVEELVALVAKQILDDRTIELTFPANPDGKYFLKGGHAGCLGRIRPAAQVAQQTWRGCDRGQAMWHHAEHRSRCPAAMADVELANQGGGPEMPRPRQRVCLDQGLKLDLNKLARQGLVRPGARSGQHHPLELHLHRRGNRELGIITANMEGDI